MYNIHCDYKNPYCSSHLRASMCYISMVKHTINAILIIIISVKMNNKKIRKKRQDVRYKILTNVTVPPANPAPIPRPTTPNSKRKHKIKYGLSLNRPKFLADENPIIPHNCPSQSPQPIISGKLPVAQSTPKEVSSPTNDSNSQHQMPERLENLENVPKPYADEEADIRFETF